MPRKSKSALASQQNGKASAPTTCITKEDRMVQQAAVDYSLVTPTDFTITKAETVKATKRVVQSSWATVRRLFHTLPLKPDKGDLSDPNINYGGFGSLFKKIPKSSRRGSRYGRIFIGTDAYKKKGKTKNHLSVETMKHKEIVQAVLQCRSQCSRRCSNSFHLGLVLSPMWRPNGM